ncbi:Wadjet anti-phage system protein JetD domain-containing protein [Cellulomonas fimi]|uniref:DUF3322 and DUF2220 domain-containing protein n=1 Tax=Cellulomonas fimi TaxID=1708 RepID=A0A7Y0LYD4_CELFI|nr:Wadjet anti-phage system protein JetD domain-containing protein [Cellulomonas fimi]NMR20468.1 hypothetical protein [Cellulomonas fimi]
MPERLTVSAARARAAAAYDRHATTWATQRAAVADVPAVDLPLHPPTERHALTDTDGVVEWATAWRGVDAVTWGRRRWTNVGEQRVPERLVLREPADVASFAGRGAHWRRLSARADDLIAAFGVDAGPVVRRFARTIVDLDAVDYARLVAVASWLVAHPDSGAYRRELPVAGVDTKWFEQRRGVVTALVAAATGRDQLGLREPPRLVRMRALDRGLAPSGLPDVSAPVDDLSALSVRARVVVVVENLQTFVALPALSGGIAVHGSGYAVDRIGRIGWVREAPIVYWGDFDRDGFAILDRLRAHCPDVRSVLMDEETLLAHRELWVADPNAATPFTPTRLTGGERRTLDALAAFGGVRLEQERLAWPHCLAALEGL